MTETGFDWRRLGASPPEVHAEPQRSTLPGPTGRWLAIAGLVATVALTGIVLASSAPRPEVVIDGSADAAPSALVDPPGVGPVPDLSAAAIMVDVDGAVVHPGLVTLPGGSRVGDAVAAAGGFAPGADARAAASINLAEPLVDGSQVTVPDRLSGAPTGQNAAAASQDPSGASPSGPLDLNHATAAELDTLPGIGPVTATKILAARDEAPFRAVDDLRTRKLVGAATFEKIKELVTVGRR